MEKTMRLNKYLSQCGIASRRKADELIDEGLVKVNGKTVYELGVKINPKKDLVVVKGRKVRPQKKKVYFLFNKPPQVLTSLSDPLGRPSLKDFFPKVKERIFPVGRLDWDSEGLLLVTNDGEFSQKVAHPRHKVSKTYIVKLDKKPTEAQLMRLKKGVTLPKGGKAQATEVQLISYGKSQKYPWAKIVVQEGRHHMVKKMFEKIGCDVKKLKRVAIGGLKLGKLPKGAYAPLTESDLKKIWK